MCPLMKNPLVPRPAPPPAAGANMPCSREAVEHLSQSGAVYVPGKAANAVRAGPEAQQPASGSCRCAGWGTGLACKAFYRPFQKTS